MKAGDPAAHVTADRRIGKSLRPDRGFRRTSGRWASPGKRGAVPVVLAAALALTGCASQDPAVPAPAGQIGRAHV